MHPIMIFFGRGPSGFQVVFENAFGFLDEAQLRDACALCQVDIDTVWYGRFPYLNSWENRMYDSYKAACIAECEAYLKSIKEAKHE